MFSVPDVCVEMIQCAVSFITARPATGIQPFHFFRSPSGSFDIFRVSSIRPAMCGHDRWPDIGYSLGVGISVYFMR
jgi:hypothetical protein